MNPSRYLGPFDLPSADRELASAGAAASLAHAGYTTREINKVETEHPLRNPRLTATSSQAACQAGRTTENKPVSREKEPPRRNVGARLAATGALSESRKRAVSAPPGPNDSSHLTHAVTAASASHKMSFRPATVPEEPRAETLLDVGKVHEAAIARARRDLQPEAEDNIHERAVVMARQMFSAMPQVATTTASVNARRPLSLHETAQRLASEKLAMMHDEQRAFRDYYSAAIPPPRRHGSLYSKLRKRAASDSGVTDRDNEQSAEIRSLTTVSRRRMAKGDAEKMARDHEALMNAAKRNAEAVIDDVDRRIYESTGRPQPRVTEKLISSQVEGENANAVPIGAGQFVTQKDVDRVARSKAKPTIDDVMRRLEEQRARAIEEELDEREAIRQQELEREREKEARKCIQEAKEEERKSVKTQKGSKKLLRRLSKSSGVGLFRRKSAKARGKVPAKEEEAPASGALADTRAPQDEEDDDWVQVPEKQSPPRSKPATSSAGESSRSVLLEPPRESLSRPATATSNRTQSGGSEKSSLRPKLWSRKKRESAEIEPSPSRRASEAGRASGDESERRKSAPVTAPTVAPLAAPANGTQATDNSPSSLSARPAPRQWNSTTESSRIISERKQQQQEGGGVLRRRSMKTKWPLRLFGKSARKPTSGAGPGSFEVQREHAIVQTAAPAPPAAASVTTGSEMTSEPLQTISSQKSSADTPTNPSKFTENL
ncbi:hypothetical protein EMPG_12478 [Blastomyces silverae]|uniref:Eisosome protein 1 n=1 Tax=Blastomyces silverae TaxID=2060906 RepID=A0A0H1BMD3_9EURO|nr:hypothetical protein EMPG_12478 [Blastomyces silverae]